MDSSTSLHAFGDIVGYSRLNAFQQAESQERFVKILNNSLLDAGVRPDATLKQDQGDARLLTFPVGTDVAWVLAVMPRRLNDELKAHNFDAAPHARMRVRLSYAMGPAVPGTTGQAGNAPIAAVRLSNATALRQAMKAVPEAYLGTIVDDYLYRQYIQQGFRPDLSPEEYLATHVSDHEKGFEADAWIRLVGYPAEGWGPLVGTATSASKRTGATAARLPADAVQLIRTGRGGPRAAQADKEGTGRRRLLSDVSAPIIAAVIVGVLGLVGVVLTLLFSGNPRTQEPRAGGTGQPTQLATQSSSASSASQHLSRTITEYADWRGGVQVYANDSGGATIVAPIPFNQGVQVSCLAPNNSAMSSINDGFYLIASGPWKGTYASANEFTNGGPREDASDPNIDHRVPHCPAS